MIRLVQNSFFGGQLDYEMMGRQDYQRYAKGATKLCNFNIMKRGGLDKRRGFDRIMNLVEELGEYGVTANTKFRAIPFAWKKSHGFVLLMSKEKCIVVGTIPRAQYGYYTVDSLDNIYSESEIQELDYQQCGDTLFIAHPNHAPAKIEHKVYSGYITTDYKHFFSYQTVNVSGAEEPLIIPTIEDAVMTRLTVTGNTNASVITEEYKVSAVYNGVETPASTAYKHFNPGTPEGSGDSSKDVTSRQTTAYRAPWTESQKIKLKAQVIYRDMPNGEAIPPEKVYFYKKAFGHFGLIGYTDGISTTTSISPTLTITDEYTGAEPAWRLINEYSAENSVTLTTMDDIDDMGSSPYAMGRRAFTFPNPYFGRSGNKFNLRFNAGNDHLTGLITCRIYLGAAYFNVYASTARIIYTGIPETMIHIENEAAGVDVYKFIREIPSKDIWLDKNNGETEADFSNRSIDYFENFFVPLISAPKYVDISFVNETSANNFSISFIRPAYDTQITLEPITTGGIAVFRAPSWDYVYFDDNYITPDTSITPVEYMTEDSIANGYNYPSAVALSQQRLIWASSIKDPQRIWMSAVGDFENYSTHEIITPSDAIDFQLPVTRFGKINHICEMRKLLLFNSACEWLVESSSATQGLTYETIQAYPQSYSGSSERLKPIVCNNSLIFCERTGQTVRRFAYNIDNDGFAGRDVSILSSSIFEHNSIVDWTYQQFPYSTLWCVLKDGSLASFEYMEEQDIMAWMTHELGGDGKVECIATSYAVSPALDDVSNVEEYDYATHEEIFAVVKRQGSLWLERMRPQTKPPTDNTAPCEDTLYHSLCLDGVRVLNSTNRYQPTTEEGAIWIPVDTTDGKPISRDEALAKLQEGVEVYEGFPFDSVYTSVYPNINNGAVGNGQFDIKHIQGCGLRLMHSYGGEVEPVGSKLAEHIRYFNNDPENDHRAVFYVDGTKKRIRLFNHDTPIMALPGVNNRDGRVTIRQSDPYPFSLLSYEIDFEPETGGYRG